MRVQALLLCAPLACATASALATLASADEPTASGVAQGLFEEARDEMRRGDYASAWPKLVESQRLDPSTGTLLNVVLCEEALGKVASAWLHAKELCDTLPERDDRRPIAARKLADLAARVPKLAVRLPPTAPSGTTVVLDGVELGPSSLGVPVPVDPRSHKLIVRAPGRPERVVELELHEGQQIEWLADVAPDGSTATQVSPVGAPSVPDPPHAAALAVPGVVAGATPFAALEPAKPRRWERWAAFGVGAAGLIAGGVLGALTIDRRATVLSDCPAKRCMDSTGLDAATEGQRLFAAALAATGVGLAGTGLGVYLVLSDRRVSSVPPGASVVRTGFMANCRFEF